MRPPAATTRCHGTPLSCGRPDSTLPTSRAWRGSPARAATAPYVVTRPRGILRTTPMIAAIRRSRSSTSAGGRANAQAGRTCRLRHDGSHHAMRRVAACPGGATVSSSRVPAAQVRARAAADLTEYLRVRMRFPGAVVHRSLTPDGVGFDCRTLHNAKTVGWAFAVDRGGTFTDVVGTAPDGSLHTCKVLSRDPHRPADPALRGIGLLLERHGAACGRRVTSVRLGTTVATNALLERAGAPTLLVTSQGMRDALLIGYQDRPDIFARAIRRPSPLYRDVVEIPERVDVQRAGAAAVGRGQRCAAHSWRRERPASRRSPSRSCTGSGIRPTRSAPRKLHAQRVSTK